ncbi:MAG: hypothetical protein HYZ58_13245 [Acidobacteria bacterium]|nr:hypothetical protein [Acidobacteriota bacterium]
MNHNPLWRLGAALIVLANVATLTAQTPAPLPNQAETPPIELESLLSAVTIVEDDLLAQEWTTVLARRSPTFRDMLRALLRTPHLRVTLLSKTDLRRTTGFAGRGTFVTHDGRVYGLLEFDRSRLDPVPQLRAIVHELAHAVEIACLPVPEETAELRRQLEERQGEYAAGFLNALETPFPNSVVRVVMAEHDVRSDTGRLRALAETFGLKLPEVEAVADTSK